MKNKSWVIILIMGIALTISLGYSIVVSQQNVKGGESTVTTKSIIEMRATTVTIKNTLFGTGVVEYEEIDSNNGEEAVNKVIDNIINEENFTEAESKIKRYQITLTIEDKDLQKTKIGQEVDISIKKEEEVLNYIGKVIKINKDNSNKSTIDIEISNSDEKIKEGMQADCILIIEKAENVVGLPIEAVQKDDQNKEFVDVIQEDGTAIPVNIKTGISDDYYVEIQYGLEVGDRVQIVKSTTTVVNENNTVRQK